jgi:hypothetical protein
MSFLAALTDVQMKISFRLAELLLVCYFDMAEAALYKRQA